MLTNSSRRTLRAQKIGQLIQKNYLPTLPNTREWFPAENISFPSLNVEDHFPKRCRHQTRLFFFDSGLSSSFTSLLMSTSTRGFQKKGTRGFILSFHPGQMAHGRSKRTEIPLKPLGFRTVLRMSFSGMQLFFAKWRSPTTFLEFGDRVVFVERRNIF